MQASAGPPEAPAPAAQGPSTPPRPIRRPLAGLAASLVAGILLGLGSGLPLPAVAAAALAVGAHLAWARSAASSVSVHVLVALAGWMSASLAARPPSPRQIDGLIRPGGEHAALIGVVADEPAVRSDEDRAEESWRFRFRIEGILHGSDWRRVRGTLQATWRLPAGTPAVAYGERWLLHGAVLPADAPAGLRRSGGWRLRVDREGCTRLGTRQVPAVLAWCQDGRRWCARALSREVEGFRDELSLVLALVLGYRGELPEPVSEAFARTGTLHVIAISGSHVGIMSLILVAVLKAAGLPRPRWIWLLAPLLILYTLGTGLSPSAVRACVMGVVFGSASLFGRRPDGWSALAFAAILILAFDPLQILDAGFLLSFVVVAGLMGMGPVLLRPLSGAARADPWALQPDAAWIRAGRGVLRRLLALAVATLAATLASLPLTAHFFNLVSPVSLVANLLVVPLAFVILLTGCLSLIAALVSPLLCALFNHANVAFVSSLLWIVARFDAVPGGHVFVRSLPWAGVLAAYVCLAALCSGRPAVRRAALAAAAVAAALAVTRAAADGRARLDVVAVGDDIQAFLDLPGSGDVLVDSGRAFHARAVLDALRRRGVDRLDAVILSRADASSAGALPALLRQVPCREIWVPRHEGRSAAFREALAGAEDRGVKVLRLGAGDRGRLAGGVEWEVLHPDPASPAGRAAEAALAIRFARGAASCLVVGSAAAAAEEAMRRQPREACAEALVICACPDAAAFTAPWLDEVGPRIVLLNPGRLEREGVRAAPLLDRIRSSGSTGLLLRDGDEASLHVGAQ